MSREYTTYSATCGKCGHKGSVSRWIDDWNRNGEIWGGSSSAGAQRHCIMGNPPKPRRLRRTGGSNKIIVADKPVPSDYVLVELPPDLSVINLLTQPATGQGNVGIQ